ncbi:H-NS family nucleoid-associated regulatory protein [Yoonia sp. TsM2_T14_4]|uniref:H-NS histone family protein n=1 Tax=Yoonia sp. TsM2_T14_4 TaxID=3415141 RepID=UPI003C76F143
MDRCGRGRVERYPTSPSAREADAFRCQAGLSRGVQSRTALCVSFTKLISTNKKTRRTYVAPKYQHPENSSLTWSGRGRKPQWFHEALASGKTPEDLAVAGAAN